MATIRRRGSMYQVQVRRAGHKLSKTFSTRQDAQQWARLHERRVDLGEALVLTAPPLIDVVERYRTEVAVSMRREENCVGLLAVMLREKWMHLPMHQIPASCLAQYRDRRLAACSTETVRRELGLLQTILRYAHREWSMPMADALIQVRKPAAGRHRTRRIAPGEMRLLLAALDPKFHGLVLFALETGLRRGELVRLEPTDIDLASSLLVVREAKNGYPRTIPLTPVAVAILQSLPCREGHRIFEWSPRAIQMRWYRAVRRAGIEDLHFHDLRHEAVSRFFEAGLSIPEVALISGHRDPRMLFRYTHLRPEDVAKKLACLSAKQVATESGPVLLSPPDAVP